MHWLVTLVLTMCTIPMLNFAIYVTNRPVRFSQVVSHRGNGFGYTENTIQAISAAFKHGYWVEMDVRISAQATPHLMHDPTVDRTTNCTGEIAAMTDNALQSCGVPTLARALELGPGTIIIHPKTSESFVQGRLVLQNTNTQANIILFVDANVDPSIVTTSEPHALIWGVKTLSHAKTVRRYANFTKDMYGVSLQTLWRDSALVRYVTQHSRNLDVWYTCDEGCKVAGNRWMSMGIPITHVEVDNPLTFESMDPSPSMMELVYRASGVGTLLAFAIGYFSKAMPAKQTVQWKPLT